MKKRKKAVIVSAVCVILAVPLVILPLAAVILYHVVFQQQCEAASKTEFVAEEHEGLLVERSDFQSEDVTLAGYQYSKGGQAVKGVIVIAPDFGGSHEPYMAWIDYFTSNGYEVFAYDVRGSGNSGGGSERGVPQGLIDLDNAIHHILAVEEYRGLPLMLFGYSWGGYSVGNVLSMHPEVKAAVVAAGFRTSGDFIVHQGRRMIGGIADMLAPYMKLYEKIRFGSEFTSVSAVAGMEKTEAGVMIIQGRNDATVPAACGYDQFYQAFEGSARFEFVLYDDRGHDDLLGFSEPDMVLMERILEWYDACCAR